MLCRTEIGLDKTCLAKFEQKVIRSNSELLKMVKIDELYNYAVLVPTPLTRTSL